MAVDPLREYPGYALRRVSAALMAALAKDLAKWDLRPSEASVLLVIEANPSITQSEIGRLLDIAGANMAPLIARLSSRELLERRAVDGRSQSLKLTASGRTLTLAARKAMRAQEERTLAKIPAEHRASFMEALRALWPDEST